ncbi:hypothetical protein BH23GEM11_BH23GEM11_06780 [soil metagenome]
MRHVLEGSERKAADTIRITAQLIHARSDQRTWSETFDRQLTAPRPTRISTLHPHDSARLPSQRPLSTFASTRRVKKAARALGSKAKMRSAGRGTLRVMRLVSPAMRELVEMMYQYEPD